MENLNKSIIVAPNDGRLKKQTIELKKLSMATSVHVLQLSQYPLGSIMTPKWVRSPCTCVRNWADLLHFLLGQFMTWGVMTLTPQVMSVTTLWRVKPQSVAIRTPWWWSGQGLVLLPLRSGFDSQSGDIKIYLSLQHVKDIQGIWSRTFGEIKKYSCTQNLKKKNYR